MGEPLVQYDASGNRSWMLADERGSIIALANDTGAMTGINTYDEYSIPGASNSGTFQYGGMLWLSRPGLYAPTFRAYAQQLGRFNQTDPMGYAGDGPNLYAYVLDDPVNFVDPLGLVQDTTPAAIVVTACENGGKIGINGSCTDTNMLPTSVTFGDTGIHVPGGYQCTAGECLITVTGKRTASQPTGLALVLQFLPQSIWSKVIKAGQRFICSGLAKLPAGTSLSLGADAQAYGGPGGYIGFSAFVDRNGNTGFNISRGGGAGFGALAGAGVSLGTTPAPGRSSISHMQGGVGIGYGGGSLSYSNWEGWGGSAGISAGPRLGYAFGSVDGTSDTTAGGNICK